MAEPLRQPLRIVFAGVGGQGTLTLAQIAMEVARRAGCYALQSEIHGMSQRGGPVHACLTIAPDPVSTPVVTEGTADLLVALEPVEALRHVGLLRVDAPLLVLWDPVPTAAGYPAPEPLRAALEAIPGCEVLEGADLTRRFRFAQAAGMVLLGRASTRLPLPRALWETVIAERFEGRGAEAAEKNLRAFAHGAGSAAPRVRR